MSHSKLARYLVTAVAARPDRPGRHRDLAGRRRRVTFLAVYAYATGGIPRAVFTVANELAERGHDVEVVSLYRTHLEPYVRVHPAVRLSYLEDQVSPDPAVTSLPRARDNPGRARLARYLDEQPSQLAAGAYPSLSGFTDLLLARKLRSLPPGIVVSTRPELAVAAVRWVQPDVITVNQEHLTYKARPEPLRQALRSTGSRLDALVTLTDVDLRRWQRQMKQATTRFAVIPNANPFPLGDDPPGSSDIVIAAGRLTSQKAFHRLIDAFAPVAAAHPRWQLHIYGTGRKLRSLRRQVNQLGLGEQVRLMGFTHELEQRLSEASVYALSSRYEGFPMVLLEAMSKGVPVASMNCPEGPRQLIEDGTNGLLVPQGDVDALSQALLRLVEDPEMRARLGAAAKETAASYTVPRVVDQWEALLDELVARREEQERLRPAGGRWRAVVDGAKGRVRGR